MSQKEQISSFIEYMYPDNEAFELCVMQSGPGNISSGYYKDKKAAVQAIMEAESRRPYGIFICANPLNDSSISGPVDNERIRGGNRSKDKDISRYNHLIVDLDPVRKSNTSATRKQHKAATSLAREIEATMSKRAGWPIPALLDTGNGAMLLYKVDLDNTSENVKKIRRCLDTLADEFSTKSVKVDVSVGNPGRLIRVPGTMNRKGTADDAIRPHRRAKLIKRPKNSDLLSEKKIRRYAQASKEIMKEKVSDKDDSKRTLNLKAYLDAYEVKYFEPKDHRGGKLYPLKACPFDPDDKPREASVSQDPEGTLFFQCFHDSCTGYKWKDFRNKISGDDNLHKFTVLRKEQVKLRRLSTISAARVARLKRLEKPLINGILERHGMLLLTGPSGVGKSMLTLHIALNVAAPGHDKQLWDLFKIQGKERVLIVQSENSLGSLNKRVTNMTKKNTKYRTASKDVLFIKEKNVGNISGDVDDDRFMNSIKRVIFRKDIGLLVLDPLISYHSENENDNVGMRKVLDKLSYLCETFQVAAIVVHHVGKTDTGKPSGGRGASAIGDWAANILSLSPYGKDSGIIEVKHGKSRDSRPVLPFHLRMTEHFDFERQKIDPKELEGNDKKARAKKWADIEAGITRALNDASSDQQTLIKQVAESLNMSPSTVRRGLKRLVKREKVLENTDGKEKIYSLPDQN